jgi:hypothetical protein
MKVWMLAGLFTVATVPFAAAAEVTDDCQLDETRRAITIQRIDSSAVGTSGGVPGATQTAQPTPPANAPQVTAARPAATTREDSVREEAQRRRSGKRVPDAELIGPRGAL